jgi:ADP-heptose:LPS heptosyltransferase
MANVLIIRISSIGDVAMTIPVIYSVAKDNPLDSFTVLTQDFLLSLFINRPDNINLIGLNTKKTEKSLLGIIRFAFHLAKNRYDIVFDLHNVIRSRIIDLVFRLKCKRVFVLDKDRQGRKKLTQKPPKKIEALSAMVTLYANVFRQAGFQFKESFVSLYEESPIDMKIIHSITGGKKGKWVGIAPFATYQGKIYPKDKMEKVIRVLSKQSDMTLFLLGGKGSEEAVLDEWASRYMKTQNLAGKYSLDQELAIISQLDILISMDSANMHFASLVNTPVISIWGATHPFAGFYGYRQSPDGAIQRDLPCRPCSVFGNKPCYRGDWACFEIGPEVIIEKVNKYLLIE